MISFSLDNKVIHHGSHMRFLAMNNETAFIVSAYCCQNNRQLAIQGICNYYPYTLIFNVLGFQVGLYTKHCRKLMCSSKMWYLTNKGFHLEFFCIDHQSLGSEANMLCSQHQPQDICKSRNREFDIIKPYIILNDAIETRQNSSQLLSSIFP